MSPRTVNRGWFWTAVVLTAAKLWLTGGQTVYAIGPAFHDDRLFVDLAAHLLNGQWLGPYNQFTLAKGPMFPLFLALIFQLGVPLILAQQALYAAACATLTRSLAPWLRSAAAQFAFYVVLLWNPMSFDAGNLSRVMRQNLYTPLALFCLAGLVALFARRRDRGMRPLAPAAGAGLAFGCFWLTREESVWLVPAVALLWAGLAWSLRRELAARWRTLAGSAGTFAVAALLPILVVCTLNQRHYGWFGTVEFRGAPFNAAYGALTRPIAGPDLEQVPVTREMREVAYRLSPAFARLRPQLEGPVGDHWADGIHFPAADRQIRGGWFVWALRDAVREAGLAPDAGTAMRFYQTVADELNAACDAGRTPARGPHSGFLPPLKLADARPLYEGALEYTAFFLQFRNFTAYAPDSEGDYAELKPFRNIVGTRLSHAPRSPDPATPEQDRRNAWKLATLNQLGLAFASLVTWLGPLLLAVGAVRLLESTLDRRITFPLGLALALLAACGAYLAINILVQVTSFYNMSPAALASAYPLYLAALGMIAVDAVGALRRSGEARRVEPVAAPVADHRAWLAPLGAAFVVLGARLGEVHFFGSDVPYNDQWVIEARQIIAPWLDGTLGLTDFFRPHFEHLPVWTRLLAWLQVAVTGRWDPLVQMTVNAVLHAGFVGLVVRWLWRELGAVPAAALTLLVVLTGALPHAWENIAWGFQSQFPLALLGIFLFVHGSCFHPAGSRRWWFAQIAGIAGLFTLASFWLAPLALVASWIWTGPRRRADLLAPALLAATGAAFLLLIHAFAENTFTQGTRSAVDFMQSALHLLGWPSLVPGAVAVIQLPWLAHALRLRNQAGTSPLDRAIFVLGLLNFAQAVALAFGRVGDNNDFVSRYGDLLVLGVLAGALALCRLTPPHGRTRTLYLAISVVWGGLVLVGLVRNSTEGHARYFHLYAEENNALRRSAVQQYLARGDRSLLEAPRTRAVLSNEVALLPRLLDQPAFRALLPVSVNPAAASDATGRAARAAQARWFWFLAAGGVMLVAGGGWQVWRRRGQPAPLPVPRVDDPWRWRIAAALGLAALLQSLTWSNPFAFDATRRWQRWLGGDQALKGLTFTFATAAPFGPERLQGAAPIRPEMLRNQFYGTAPEGPGFTGTVLSSTFTVTKPWLIVPYAGYPVGNGNGLRIRLVGGTGRQVGEEIGCPGPNGEGIAYWVADLRAHVGQSARLVLYDGRTDTEAWVAASPPVPAERPDVAVALARGLEAESHSAVRITTWIIALVGLGGAGLTARRSRAPRT